MFKCFYVYMIHVGRRGLEPLTNCLRVRQPADLPIELIIYVVLSFLWARWDLNPQPIA